MRFKEIMNRISKLERCKTDDEMVKLICLKDGEEYKKTVTTHEACMMALKQGTAYLFGTSQSSECIVRVETGDDDGFIMALLDGMEDIDPEEVKKVIEV